MDDLERLFRKLFPILLMVLVMLPGAVLSKRKRGTGTGPKGRGGPGRPPPMDEGELARRVHKNFEELLRRRSGEAAGPSAGPVPLEPASPPRARRPAPVDPRRRTPRPAPRPAVPRDAYHPEMASAAGPIRHDHARRILAAGGPLGRAALRRAVLLKEILDVPVALRPPGGPR